MSCPRCLMVVLLCMTATQASSKPADNSTVGGFQSGLLYVTPQGRLTLPPTSLLLLTPTLSIPAMSDLPIGFGSSATISIPFKIFFDDLGMTSPVNTWGTSSRNRREAPPSIGNLAGGDREVIYRVAENTLQTTGVNGRACLLRTICEVSQFPFENFGLFGEILQLVLNPTRSPRHLGEYTEAEEEGRSTGHCKRYHADCPYSFFTDTIQATNPLEVQ